MDLISLIMIGYGIVLIVGGILGYFFGGSTISLVAGVLSGLFIQGTTLLAKFGYPHAAKGTVICALVLTGMFGYRYWATGAFLPSGLYLIISFAALCTSISMLFKGTN